MKDTSLFCSLIHLSGFRIIHTKLLFYEHMFPGSDCREGNRGMEKRRGGDHDCIDRWMLDQCFIGCKCLRHMVFLGTALQKFGIDITQCYKLCIGAEL